MVEGQYGEFEDISTALDNMMGCSYNVYEDKSYGGFDLDLDTMPCFDINKPTFALTMGTGFSGRRSTVNMEIQNLTLADVEEMVSKLQDVVTKYKNAPKRLDFELQ